MLAEEPPRPPAARGAGSRGGEEGPGAGPRAGMEARGGMCLPRGPGNLCFDKDEFMKPDFDVDHFVSDCRKRVQLEELRDDLELYYKLLKTSMVELINKDYADFVNLSTNLVGMDKALNQLSVPLGQLREEVMSLKSCVSEGIRAVDERMSKQEDIRRKKMCVLRLIQVIQSVEKIEKILHSQSSKELSLLEANSPLLTGQILERIATEFNQLQFHAVQSKGMPLLDKVRPVIVEQYVQSHPNGLQAMYNKLLEFVPHHCRLLREVTGGAMSSEKANIVPGYDFLVNSVWPEIVHGLEEKLQSLFNPGNPDVFHEKYTISMDFIQRFERQCGSQASVKRLRLHPAYLSFNNKWNLPVYFQIRFREVAGALEAALSDSLEEAPAGSSYCLLATHLVWVSLLKCWSDQMFLPLLAHRLWKFTLQILARYSVFINELLLRPISSESTKDNKKSVATSSKESSVNPNSSEDQGNGSPETQRLPSISSTQLVYIAADLDRLKEQLPELLEIIKPKLEMIGFKNISCITGALEDSQASLSASMPTLNNKIIQDLSESCFSYLKSALEVPRHYRRTNKEVPTKASPYVDSALKPFYRLQNEYKDMLTQPRIHQWLESALSESTQKYYETVSDVLSSVKKMEESLKRLKQARKTVIPNHVSSNGGMSDDNKIRLQLALDVEYFGDQMQKMGLQTSNIKSFSALLELVLAAKDQTTVEQS
ncbi:conserved oligomeric Golgi complex subunit 2 isoform X2 [Chelonia mydas]|uniref:conserved oligomeric Golgi complex subunit 2 isoform X2 n=1 Tax=Chelonia mydas TaxID=8469 RepID=UPI0018A23E54|nr:conserved oligomeric Golgi complex subunit 2 isoform X2 [Chelonia mydas]